MSMFTPSLLASLESSTVDVSSAETLPSELYTSDEFLAFEREALFMKEWLAVGRAERLSEPGDWFTVDLLGEPIIVVRTKDGDIRAMSAVCQHRAMQVCEGSGNATTFKCPYHHWIYGQDGRLLGAPAMERTEDFDKADFGLPSLKVEEWLGFIFVNFDADAAPLEPTLDRYTPYLANYDLGNAVCPGTFTLEGLPWNWKVMFENFNDGYHANRLASVRSRLLSVRHVRVPRAMGGRVERDLPYCGIHPHRRRVQRNPSGDHGRLPGADRRGAVPVNVCADPTDALFRQRPRPVLLLPGTPHWARDDRC